MFECISTSLMLLLATTIAKLHPKLQPSDSVPTSNFLTYDSLDGKPYTVTYDERSFIINGERTLLLGGSVHYPRLSPGQYSDILTKAKNDGLNHVEVYVFWNYHEPYYNFNGTHIYNFNSERGNITGFLDVAKEVGIFVNLRIGPYVCAEWSFGGLPLWLLQINDIKFRDNNDEWKEEMGTFIKNLTKVILPYLAKNGGPIILAQIENEYRGSTEYVTWCGNFAASLNYEIPWVMCNGLSANNTVNTCNGNNCYTSYAPTHSSLYPGQPLGWTENEGWFQYWDGNNYQQNVTGTANRSPSDMAYSVATWFAAGGAHHNYYMWYGGNHISWTAGSSITNYYADGVNYHGDGLAHEPKRSHLMRLHNILAEKQKALLEDSIQIGHEIYLVPNGGGIDNTSLYSLNIDKCNENSDLQKWKFTGLLQLIDKDNGIYCVISTGNSNPVRVAKCDSDDAYQQWIYETSLQIKSQKTGSCLDIYDETSQIIDEWTCKSSSDSDVTNQQWMYNETTGLVVSKYNTDYCLTAANKTTTFAYVYQGNTEEDRVVFLVNTASTDYKLTWEGITYDVPGNSLSILDYEGEELYNTDKIDSSNLPTKRVYKTIYSGKTDLTFESWNEYIPLQNNTQKRSDKSILKSSPQEQLRFANGTSEYLYYSTKITTNFNNYNNDLNSLYIQFSGRAANAYIIWFNNKYIGSLWNGEHSSTLLNYSIQLNSSYINNNMNCGTNTCIITILSSSLGVNNGIANQAGPESQDMKGIISKVWLYDSNTKKIIDNYSNNGWYHWIGSTGENLNVATSKSSNVTWNNPAITNSPMTWYRTYFATPDIELFNKNIGSTISGTFLLDIGSNGLGFGRGHFWLNGIDMGHYNNIVQKSNGIMMQQYYFIPIDYLLSMSDNGLNELVFQEELPIQSTNDISNMNLVYSTIVIPE